MRTDRSTKLERKIAAVKPAIEFLKSRGEHKMAQDVNNLCRAATMIRVTASTLHAELEDTRRAAGLPTWERTNASA